MSVCFNLPLQRIAFLARLISPTVAGLLCCVFSVHADEPARISVTAGHPQVTIEQRAKDSEVFLTIHDMRGIGSATFERTADRWPEKLTLFFRLKGLEHAEIVVDETKLIWSVSSSQPDMVRQSIQIGKADPRPLQSGDPLFVELHKLPGTAGFEVSLPSELWKGSPSRCTLRWIDFYR